ncbi:hypothetical protein B0H12DRAFT_1239146 [Mycena haematopus]|nr:hypothetical protein B0H12DRAFT_1239146 [Mycena haematopus]
MLCNLYAEYSLEPGVPREQDEAAWQIQFKSSNSCWGNTVDPSYSAITEGPGEALSDGFRTSVEGLNAALSLEARAHLIFAHADDGRLVLKVSLSSICPSSCSSESTPPGHGSPYAPMTLNLSKKFRGVKQDFFRAGDHQCDFVVLIPKVRPAVYNTNHHDDNDSDTEHPAASGSGSSSVSASSSPRFDDNDPRVMSSPNTTPTSSPVPSGALKSSTHSGGKLYHARAHPDLSVVNECWDAIVAGRFESVKSYRPSCFHIGKAGIQTGTGGRVVVGFGARRATGRAGS